MSAYVDHLVEVIGHADRVVPLRDYCLGLLMPLERKSVEPMAAVTAPARAAAKHQSLLRMPRDETRCIETPNARSSAMLAK